MEAKSGYALTQAGLEKGTAAGKRKEYCYNS